MLSPFPPPGSGLHRMSFSLSRPLPGQNKEQRIAAIPGPVLCPGNGTGRSARVALQQSSTLWPRTLIVLRYWWAKQYDFLRFWVLQ
jgi:hypothetical protein